MKTSMFLTAATCAAFFITSCGNNAGNEKKDNADSTKPVQMAAVSIGSVTPSPDFPNASLGMGAVKTEKAGNDSTKVTFNFDVKNYELKLQTSDNANKMCNNSDKGQHIHFIMDNGPYKPLYEPANSVTLANNTEHYLVAFLSRSYHESIKSKGAAIMFHFKIDEKGNMKKLDDPKTPMITYSRPKGEYTGSDTTNVMMDFYVWNCDIAADGYKVKAEISNEDKATQQLTTTLDKWQPYFIHNLGTGKCKVVLTLMDKDGKPAEGPNTTVTREFNLKAQ